MGPLVPGRKAKLNSYMWTAAVDRELNLLEIRFSDKVTVTEAEACALRIRALLPDLRPDFTLLTDLSQLGEMDLSCERYIDEMMDQFNRASVRKVVRVVPDPRKDIGLGIMSAFHYSRDVRVVTCEALTEAQEHLPQAIPRDSTG